MLLLNILVSCRYGFVLEGTEGGKRIALDPSTNNTHLREAGIVLDSYLEQALASMGMLSPKNPEQRLVCSLVASSRTRITSASLKAQDRYRLTINVLAKLSNTSGKVIWQYTFTDTGTFTEGGQDEDALDEACRQVSLQIARALAALQL
ncbi:MAG TPA: LPS assembly lipoprotein LptE [Desulfomonilia bacterium]|nr:LPS assembly lipoprotein LptE [Desulfomonilia bacterium]